MSAFHPRLKLCIARIKQAPGTIYIYSKTLFFFWTVFWPFVIFIPKAFCFSKVQHQSKPLHHCYQRLRWWSIMIKRGKSFVFTIVIYRCNIELDTNQWVFHLCFGGQIWKLMYKVTTQIQPFKYCNYFNCKANVINSN